MSVHSETRHKRDCDLCHRTIEEWREGSEPREPAHCGTFLPIEHGVRKLNLRITSGPAVPGGQPAQPEEHDLDICRICTAEILRGLANRLESGKPVVGAAR